MDYLTSFLPRNWFVLVDFLSFVFLDTIFIWASSFVQFSLTGSLSDFVDSYLWSLILCACVCKRERWYKILWSHRRTWQSKQIHIVLCAFHHCPVISKTLFNVVLSLAEKGWRTVYVRNTDIMLALICPSQCTALLSNWCTNRDVHPFLCHASKHSHESFITNCLWKVNWASDRAVGYR